ncbi:hypothetical protein K9M74_00580 [Candidatus Woesearchaeota archaeon]|nr:hypothetical protein [Candidatus Woesearchaeota archaeon]
MQQNTITLFLRVFLLALLLVFSTGIVSAEDVTVINSEDWVDVYSVMLKSALEGRRALFVNGDSATGFANIINPLDTLQVYTSVDTPYIDQLDKQLTSIGYDVRTAYANTNFNYDLDPGTGNYILISLDNPRIAASIAPLAVKQNAWVFIVDKENAADIAKATKGATSVIAVGNFGRDVLKKIQPRFTTWINTGDLYADSQEIATLLGVKKTVILTDGSFIETEFFASSNPVLLSGPTRLFSKTFAFLEANEVSSVVIVGNQLAAIGEQIRDKSNKEISVFIKFGQGDTMKSANIYALSMFPLPVSRLGLTVQQAIYNPATQELIATFKNTGNIGVYELSTIVIKNGEEELASVSLPDVTYIAGGELLPVIFPVALPIELITPQTSVEFYTSYGITPTGLDRFLTEDNILGNPFTLPLTLQTIADDGTLLYLVDSSYYKGIDRVGVELHNPTDIDAYVSVKVNEIMVNGLPKTLYKQGKVKAGQTTILYLPAKLDRIDLQENEELAIVVTYGKDESMLLKTISAKQPFKVVSGGRITGLVTGIGGGSAAIGWGIVMIVLLGSLYVAYFFVRKKNNS